MVEVTLEAATKAVGAIKAYLAGELKNAKDTKRDLFEAEEYISIQIGIRKIPQHDRLKPIRLPIPNSIYGRDGVSICLFTKDPQSEWDEFVEANPLKNIKKVVALKTLKTDYKSYQHRRELLNQFDFFLADDRVTPMLPSLLGSKFYDSKSQPPAVRISSGSYKKSVSEARDSTYMTIPKGAVISVRVGHSSMSKDDIAQNIVNVLPKVIEHLPGKESNVQSVYLKSNSSVSLPLFNSLPTVEDYRQTAEEKKAELDAKVSREHKIQVKLAASFGLTVTEYSKALKSAQQLNIPVGKYIKSKQKRSMQATLEKKTGKTAQDVLQETEDKVAEVQKIAKELSDDEEVNAEVEKRVKKLKPAAPKKDGAKVVKLAAPKKK